MSIRGWLRRRFKEAKEQEFIFNEEVSKFRVKGAKSVVVLPKIDDITKLDIKYPLVYPFAFARIFWDDKSKSLLYKVIEPQLNEEEKMIYKRISDGMIKILELELEKIKSPEKLLKYLQKKVSIVLNEYGLELKPGQYTRIMYYIYRNFIGLNEIEPLMNDPYIEDISCDGVEVPLYLIHKKYGSIKTNIQFNEFKGLQEFVIKLAERSGRYVSYAEPLLDGTLADGSRVQATLAKDITTKGPTFSIRKFRKVPYSAVDMIRLKTASSELLAFIWYALEHKTNILVVGGTASGKTTFLNSIVAFIPPEDKIISIEDTRELNLPHQNWIPSVSRVGFGTVTKEGTRYGEVTMFDLLKESFRQNPDYVIVGEVRGKEAYVLFQGMASGHSSLGTVHGGSVDDIIKRMETPPISLPPSLLESLDLVIVITHATQFGKSARRIKQISELGEINPVTGKVKIVKSFEWSPLTDKHTKGDGIILEKLSAEYGKSIKEIENEIEDRNKVLKWLSKNKINRFDEVAKYISMYYKNKDEVLNLLKKGKIKEKQGEI